jgi:polyhydroxybutyrate depolymerase
VGRREIPSSRNQTEKFAMHPDRLYVTVARIVILPLAILCILNVSGCSNSNSSGNPAPANSALASCADNDSCASNPTLEIGKSRPAQVLIPSDYNTSTRYPLIILLHGYGANGFVQMLYLGLDTRVDAKQYVLVTPDGTPDIEGTRFWNSTPACCAFSEQDRQVDDVSYIRSLVEEAAATYSIDTRRIGLVGHSNGGFMALRMACEASDIITAVVSLAGSTFAEDSSCAPASFPVSVLAMHGDSDQTIFYEGSPFEGSYPGAKETIARFAAHAGCDTNNPFMSPGIDLVGSLEGDETIVLTYGDCDQGADVALWTIVDGPHSPFPWADAGVNAYLDWIIEHQRPGQ